MQRTVVPTCLCLLLSSVLLMAQNTSSSEPQQSVTNPQAKPDKTPGETDNQNAKDESEHSHKTHLRLGTVSLAAGYSHFSGPLFFSPFWPYGFYPYSFAYSPFFYDPFYGPYFGPYGRGLAYGPDKGEVKLNANPKKAQVFVDGAYAGTADHLKDMWLDSGAYDLAVSAPGRETFHQRIYILSGKSLKIDARLKTEEKP